MRVHVLFESQDLLTPNGSSYIRLLRPLSHPSLAGKVELSFAAEMTAADVDMVVIDRLWRGDLTPARQSTLLRSLAARGIPYVYSIDDNLLDLNLEPGHPPIPSVVRRNLIREFIRSAAGVIVSTGPLSDRLKSLHANVVVVPNQIDETLFTAALPAHRGNMGIAANGGGASDSENASKAESAANAENAPNAESAADASGAGHAERSRVVIGYMGTYSHLDDLMMIAHPLRRLLARNPGRVRLEFVGVADREELLALFPGAAVDVLRVPGASVRYPEFVPWMQRSLRWDFALGPLRTNDFNRSKSDIKWLDYGMLGIPGIFSATPAYERSVEHGATGLLVNDSTEAWAAALDRMAGSIGLRARLSTAARRKVSSTRTLSGRAVDWLDAIEQILAAAAGRTPPLPAPQWAA